MRQAQFVTTADIFSQPGAMLSTLSMFPGSSTLTRETH
jgi:hypothetical protein